MSHASEYPVTCCEPNCPAKHPSGKWGKIRATTAGWYHDTSGRAYCPMHVPKWVARWRTK